MSAENGNGKGAFWKAVGIVAVGILAWIGTQLIVVPTHTYQLQNHEQRIGETERQLAAQKAATEELIALLKAEARERRRDR